MATSVSYINIIGRAPYLWQFVVASSPAGTKNQTNLQTTVFFFSEWPPHPLYTSAWIYPSDSGLSLRKCQDGEFSATARCQRQCQNQGTINLVAQDKNKKKQKTKYRFFWLTVKKKSHVISFVSAEWIHTSSPGSTTREHTHYQCVAATWRQAQCHYSGKKIFKMYLYKKKTMSIVTFMSH